MKPKQILIVLVAFVVLGLLYWIQQKQQRPATQGLGYEQVLGEGLAGSDVREFKCYLSGREEEAIHLAREEEGWVVRSKFNAPAQESKVNELLDQLAGLKGELRSSSKEVLEDYGITDEGAVHLVLFDAEGEEIEHLLLGKRGPAWNETFVRRSGSSDVYLVGENLRNPFGLYAEDDSQAPESKTWCDLVLMELSAGDLRRVEWSAPYRRVVLEQQEQAPPEIEAASGEEAPPPLPPEKIWALVEPDFGVEPKQSGINRLTGALADVRVSDVIARGNLAEYGLDVPSATCSLVTQAGEIHHLRVGAPAGGGAYYVRRDEDELVFKMDRWKLDAIFLGLSQFVDLKAPTFPQEEVAKLSVEAEGRVFEFARDGDAWRALRPAVELEPKGDRLDKVLKVVAALQPQDLATRPAPEIIGLDAPAAVVRFTLKDGQEYQVAFGNEVPVTDGGRFVRLDDREEVWTVTRANWNDAKPGVSELFDLKLMDFDTEGVTALTLRDASGELRLALQEAPVPEEATGELPEPKWVVEARVQSATDIEAMQGTVRSLLSTLSGLTASDLFEPTTDTGLEKPSWSATLTLSDGTVLTLDLGHPAEAGTIYAQVKGKKALLGLPSHQVQRLQELSKKLRE